MVEQPKNIETQNSKEKTAQLSPKEALDKSKQDKEKSTKDIKEKSQGIKDPEKQKVFNQAISERTIPAEIVPSIEDSVEKTFQEKQDTLDLYLVGRLKDVGPPNIELDFAQFKEPTIQIINLTDIKMSAFVSFPDKVTGIQLSHDSIDNGIHMEASAIYNPTTNLFTIEGQYKNAGNLAELNFHTDGKSLGVKASGKIDIDKSSLTLDAELEKSINEDQLTAKANLGVDIGTDAQGGNLAASMQYDNQIEVPSYNIAYTLSL